MIRQEVKKCCDSNCSNDYLYYLNIHGKFNTVPRNLQYQQKIINKLKIKAKNILTEANPQGAFKCKTCHSYIISLIKYFDSLDWTNIEARYEIEYLIHNTTLTVDRRYVKLRTKFRGIK